MSFVPVATAQGALVGSLVTVAPSRILGDLDGLSQRLGLPMMLGRELLSSLDSLGMSGKDVRIADIVDRIDPTSGVAIVWTMSQQPAVKGFCAALTFKDAASAKRTADEMGIPSPPRNGVIERRSSREDVIFTAIKGRTLFVSGSAEALLFAGGLAEAARVPPLKGQLVLTVLPQALAKASGKSPDAIVTELTAMATEGFAKSGTKSGTKNSEAMGKMVVAMLETAARIGLDSSAARLILEVGPREGLVIQAELVPAAGTDFATRTAHRAPYTFDARLPVRSDGTTVMAIGDVSMWLSTFGKMLEATGPAGHAALRDIKAMSELGGEWSCVLEPAQTGIATLCSSALKPGVTTKAALDAATAWLVSQNAWEAELDGRKAKPMKIKRSAEMIEIEKKIESKEPVARALSQAMAGGDSFKHALTVKNGRLLQATGHAPKDILAHYGAGASSQDAPLVAASLARTKSDEGMASVDFISLLLHLFRQGKGLPGAEMVAMASAVPGLADLRAPFHFALRTGNSLTGEFRIPLGSLDNIAKVVRGMLGAAQPSP